MPIPLLFSIVVLTQYPQPVVDGDHDHPGEGCQSRSVVNVAAAPTVGVSVDEEHHGKSSLLFACKTIGYGRKRSGQQRIKMDVWQCANCRLQFDKRDRLTNFPIMYFFFIPFGGVIKISEINSPMPRAPGSPDSSALVSLGSRFFSSSAMVR